MEEDYGTLYINPDTRDIEFDGAGNLRLIAGDEAATQNIRQTLLIWKKEWPLNLEHGTDYEKILGRKLSDLADDEAEEVLREAIFQEPRVREISSLTLMRQDGSLHVEFEAVLDNGHTVFQGVTADE
ncbi:MAG: DUF2634 domain-containing protein [Provencibacterium sp.]|jgi:hypothetical protein|nr:DUF2634 domain-containing protein [Provencibacterium sp.]